MEPIGKTLQKLASRDSRAVSAETSKKNGLLSKRHSTSMPAILVRETDIEIPRRVWSGWLPSGIGSGNRQLRRPLSDVERGLLEARKAELEPWVDGYHEQELDHVVLALMELYGGFTSMRQSGEEAAARVDSVRRLLAEYPLWAIERVCERIRKKGYWVNGSLERHWPPSDPEIVEAVRIETTLYRDQFDSAVKLLAATVAAS